MAWTRIDDKFLLNPKIQTVGVHGMALYLSGLIYCNSNLTDGYIDDVFLPQIYADAFCRTPKITMQKLVDCGLWIRVEGGYQIPPTGLFEYTRRSVVKQNPIRMKFKSIRKRAWKYLTDNYETACAYCGSTEDLTIDHIKPIAKGGTNGFDNLQILCRSCNSRKHVHYGEE